MTKACLECGTRAEDDASVCLECGRKFSFTAETGGGSSPVVVAPVSSRPDGSAPMVLGWCCLALSLLTGVAGMGGGPRGGMNAFGESIALNIASGWFFSLFLVLWGVGYIVKAISFLPGRSE